MTKTALVTGGNRGIGLEVVKKFAALGYKVLLGCRNVKQGLEAAYRLTGDIDVVEVDLSDSDKVRAQAAAIMADHDIDILINNGAILKDGSTLSVERQDFYDSIQVNLISCFDLIQMITPGMIERGFGRIVNVTSDWGSFADGLTGPAAYSVSKAALNALTMNMAHSLPANIKVNSVHPGWIKTDMGGDSAPLSTQEGAKTIIWLATLADDGPSGGFFNQKQPKAW
jgi:NAD(P)-dependent dehydrogenase (short-subunit alcohol dehydrogenase family)|tara:strand:+ start:404116 stop:404793 length:678 start_codon:yes stop_codon:yes gene_type:complete